MPTDATTTALDQVNSNLFRLPAELRIEIYKEVLSLTFEMTWSRTFWNAYYTANAHPLLSTCKRICAEAMPYVYHTFRIPDIGHVPMVVGQWNKSNATTALTSGPLARVMPHVRQLHVYFRETRFLYFTTVAVRIDGVQAFIDGAGSLERVFIQAAQCDCSLWRYAGGGHTPGCQRLNVLNKLRGLKANCRIDLITEGPDDEEPAESDQDGQVGQHILGEAGNHSNDVLPELQGMTLLSS